MVFSCHSIVPATILSMIYTCNTTVHKHVAQYTFSMCRTKQRVHFKLILNNKESFEQKIESENYVSIALVPKMMDVANMSHTPDVC